MPTNSELISIVYRTYQIPSITSCAFIRSSFNIHHLIKTIEGNYVLREYINNRHHARSKRDFLFELELLQHLANHNVSTIPSFKNREGQLLSSKGGKEGEFIALFPFAEGKPIEEKLPKEKAIKLGELLASIHLKSESFSSSFSRYQVNVNELLWEPFNLIERYSVKFALRDLNVFLPYFSKLEEGFTSLPKTKDTYGIIHGDPNPSNFYYCEKKGFSVFDFDHCGFGFRIHDLSVIKLSFSNDTYHHVQKGYETHRPLNVLEKNFIDTYGSMLMIKKFRDILDMLEIKNATPDEKKRVTLQALNTLEVLSKDSGDT